MNYQVHYAALRALLMLPRVFASPHIRFQLQLEPRVGRESPTEWDLAFEPGRLLVEAKLRPTKQDVLSWLQRSRASIEGGETGRRFRLLAGVSEGRHVRHLRALIRLSKEAGSDASRFEQLLGYESESYDELLTEIGTNRLSVLKHLDIEVASPESIKEQIDALASLFAGQSFSQLRDHLFRRIAHGLENRITIDLRDELTAFEEAHGALSVPQFTEPENLDNVAGEALYLLQSCQKPLPRSVLAEVLGIGREQLSEALKQLTNTGVVVFSSDTVAVKPLPRRVSSKTGDDRRVLLVRALTQFVGSLPLLDTRVRDQVANLCHLATRTAADCKEAVAGVFMGIDKHLKQLGDKHIVLEMAKVSIAAARAALIRSEEIARGEAHALICGESWVYQRVGRLDEARHLAEESFERGQAIGWTRNDAFCEKCIGRLCRMMAEIAVDPLEKARLLNESAYRLERAIELFSSLNSFGPKSTEVGECHSLLGRTLMLMDEITAANERVAKAQELITLDDSKEGMDLLILRGELAAREGDSQAAEHFFDTVLSDNSLDVVRTEMRARAHVQRARVRLVQRKVDGADADYHAAENIWRGLQEQHAAATPAIERMLMHMVLPPERLSQIRTQRPEVAAIALRLHAEKLAQLQTGSSRRARDAGDPYWEQLIKEARKQWVLEGIEW